MRSKGFMTGIIEGNNPVAPDHFHLRIQLPIDFSTPLPGQFVMVRTERNTSTLLARPLSVFGFKRRSSHAELELLYRVAGSGTSLLTRMRPEDRLKVLGPLGRGFTLPEGMRRILFVAGGIGVAPLIYLLKSELFENTSCPLDKHFYLGARSGDLLAGMDRLQNSCELGICTDDGSRGYHGQVTALLERDITRGDMKEYDPKATMIYACGPAPMIRSLWTLLKIHPIPCQVSLEERMACGLGACLGCAVAIRGLDDKKEYQRVCKDGPVFDLQRVLL